MAFGAVKRFAELVLGADDRQLAKGLRRARKRVRGFAKDSGSFLKGAFGPLAALGSAAGLASVAGEVFDFQEKVTRLGIQANLSAQQTKAFGAEMEVLSNKTGLTTNEIAAGASKFVSLTGDVNGARASLDLFARTSVATGSSIEDVAATAAALAKNLHVAPDDMEKALSGLVVQGKAGAIELRELAGLLSSIAPQMTRFGVTGTDAVAELGAALQVVRQGFGSGSQAVTGMNALFSSLSRHAAKFADEGVEMFVVNPKTGVKEMRRFSDIIRDIGKSDLAKSNTRLIEAFGSTEALRAFEQLNRAPELMHELFTASQRGDAIQRDYVRFQESAAGRLRKAWTQTKNAVATAFTPERIAAFAQALSGAVRFGREVASLLGAIGDRVSDITGAGRDFTAPTESKADPRGKASGREITGRQSLEFAAGQLGIPIQERGVPLSPEVLATKVEAALAGRGEFDPRTGIRQGAGATAEQKAAARNELALARKRFEEAATIRAINEGVKAGHLDASSPERAAAQLFEFARRFADGVELYEQVVAKREAEALALIRRRETEVFDGFFNRMSGLFDAAEFAHRATNVVAPRRSPGG